MNILINYDTCYQDYLNKINCDEILDETYFKNSKVPKDIINTNIMIINNDLEKIFRNPKASFSNKPPIIDYEIYMDKITKIFRCVRIRTGDVYVDISNKIDQIISQKTFNQYKHLFLKFYISNIQKRFLSTEEKDEQNINVITTEITITSIVSDNPVFSELSDLSKKIEENPNLKKIHILETRSVLN